MTPRTVQAASLQPRDLEPDPPVILDPLVVLLSARAVKAARELLKVEKQDWSRA